MVATLSLVAACNKILGNEPGVLVQEEREILGSEPPKDEVAARDERDEPPRPLTPANIEDAGHDASSDSASTSPVVDAALACASGLADCNGRADDGCEADLRSSSSSCGVCGLPCVDAPPNATPRCDDGVCAYRCSARFGDCNKQRGDGCEADLFADEKNCGECGTNCIFGGRCESGTCIIRF